MARRGDDGLFEDLSEGLVSMVPIVGPVIAPFAKRLAKAAREEHRRNASVALRAAARVASLSPEDLADRIAADPRLVPLLSRVLHAAAMSGQDEHLIAMGAALGDAVEHPSRVDEAEIVLIALQDLRTDHINILRLLASQPPDSDKAGSRVWYPFAIAERSGMDRDLTYLCIAGLVNSGLVTTRETYNGSAYQQSELGRTVLELLAELGSGGQP